MNQCEHCARTKAEPIIISSGGEMKAFCSAECVMLEDGGKGDLWKNMVKMRDELLASMEKSRQSRVITLIHRCEFKEGGDQYITIDNTEEILQEIRATPAETRIDFIIHCPGGMALPAEQIALALRSHSGGVSAIVPYYAMSGATLVCVAADEVIMEPFSVLGPLDPQIGDFPSPSLLKLLEVKPVQSISDEMVMLADLAEKALGQMMGFVVSLLSDRMNQEEARKVAEYFTGGYLTHDSAITFRELKSLGLPVKIGVPPEVHRFMRMHRLVQRSPSGGSGPIRYSVSGQGSSYHGRREDRGGGSANKNEF